MEAAQRILREYVDALGRNYYQRWFERLARATQVRIDARLALVRAGNLGDHRSVGHGVMELRLSFGPGYRIYFGIDGTELVILLAGGDKSSQDTDITLAHKLWEEYKHGN
jgi:putative addiction module killer protein